MEINDLLLLLLLRITQNFVLKSYISLLPVILTSNQHLTVISSGCANEDLGIMADPLARWNITTPATLSYRQKNGSSSATPVRTWCTSGHGGDMWLQVDLAYMQYLCAVEVRLQAANNSTANYTVSRSLDGLSWEMFAGNKIPKVVNFEIIEGVTSEVIQHLNLPHLNRHIGSKIIRWLGF